MQQSLRLDRTAFRPTTPPKLTWWRRYGTQLLILVMVLALVPVTLASAINVLRQRSHNEELVSSQLESVAALKSAQIEAWLEQTDFALDLTANNPPFHNWLLSTLASPSPATSTALLAEMVSVEAEEEDDAAVFESFTLYDTEGRIVASSEGDTVGKTVALQPFFAPSLEDEEYLQTPYFSLDTQDLTMVLTSQVRDNNDELRGVLAATLNLEILADIINERAGLQYGGVTYLVSVENNYPLAVDDDDEETTLRALRSEGISAALRGEDGGGYYRDYTGTEVIGHYLWIPELQAALIAEADYELALASTEQTQNLSIAVAGVAALLAISAGLFFAGRFTRPIADLTAGANRIAQGDFSSQVRVQSSTELGQLAGSFNLMTTRI